MLGLTLVIVMIAQEASDPPTIAFERAARSVLGAGTELRFEQVDADPADDETTRLGSTVDGVVELSWSTDRTRVRLHCYLSREQRWVDREIAFGDTGGDATHETRERGRLLGFAVASMFSDERERPASSSKISQAPKPIPPPSPAPGSHDQDPRRGATRTRSLEFAGIVSSGIHGTAAGLGAMAGVRVELVRPLAVRGFVAGRTGNIPKAQASTTTAEAGAGVSIAFLPSPSRWEAGLRVDGMLSYFEASHLSEDDVGPDRRERWLPGADLLAEAGFRFADSAGLHLAAGVEAMLGATEIFTHGNQVAVVPPLRAVAELGFRAHF